MSSALELELLELELLSEEGTSPGNGCSDAADGCCGLGLAGGTAAGTGASGVGFSGWPGKGNWSAAEGCFEPVGAVHGLTAVDFASEHGGGEDGFCSGALCPAQTRESAIKGGRNQGRRMTTVVIGIQLTRIIFGRLRRLQRLL